MDLWDVVTRAGLVQRHRGFGPCPVCRAEVRGHDDRRPPVAVYWLDGELRWHCKASGCGVGGGTRSLVAALRFGEVPPAGDPRWAALRAEDLPAGIPHAAALPAPPAYPPVTEVLALWRACTPLTELSPESPVKGYLHTRGINTHTLGILDLSRELSDNVALPSWVPNAVVDTRMPDRGYRLVTPMFDALGTLRSVRFRAIGPLPSGRKTLNPRGFGYAGLVMADPMARDLLSGRRAPSIAWDGRVVLVEGEPDFWTWACHPARDPHPSTWAVFGIAAGSWTSDIAARLPDSARIILRTHHDPAGDGYAARVFASFAGRNITIMRSNP